MVKIFTKFLLKLDKILYKILQYLQKLILNLSYVKKHRDANLEFDISEKNRAANERHQSMTYHRMADFLRS